MCGMICGHFLATGQLSELGESEHHSIMSAVTWCIHVITIVFLSATPCQGKAYTRHNYIKGTIGNTTQLYTSTNIVWLFRQSHFYWE